jgi:GTP cyclohydrolase I
VRFPLFVDRSAPVSGLAAPQRYEVRVTAATDGIEETVRVAVRVPVTSLCPCSREISDYGAHSQRGYVDLEVESPGWRTGEGVWPEELFAYADAAGSAPIYPVLKRVDERAVTMQAYDRPAFVEDIARDVVVAVRGDERCVAWSVSVENQESIHDHQAVASVRGER